MFRIREAIAVEGRYDKNVFVPGSGHPDPGDGGFQIFKDPERMALLDRAARRRD